MPDIHMHVKACPFIGANLPSLRKEHYAEGADVFDFHTKFLVPMSNIPAFLDKDAYEYRKGFLYEELKEFCDAHERGDLIEAGDGLVDLVVVALGTALMMGLPWRSMWDRVMHANMQKKRANDDGSDSKRGSPLDIVKPEGWVAPDHTEDLGKGPWPTFNATHVQNQLAAFLRGETPPSMPTGTFEGKATVSVEVRPDGTKHYTSVAEPAVFKRDDKRT